MGTRVDFDSFHGERRDDGTIIGFDYTSQKWVDTALGAKRDTAFPAGSASNPLAHLRDLPKTHAA